MILLVHFLFGAAIGSTITNIPLAIVLAFFSHYFLDFFPHIEYSIENIEKKQWRKITPDILKISLDFFSGILFVFLLSKNQPIIYICALFSLLPDAGNVLRRIAPNKFRDKFHEKVHFLKDKKISFFWRILSQIMVLVLSIFLLNI